MNKLDMIKAFANLEGIELTKHKDIYLRKSNDGNVTINGIQFSIYDPILDFALTFKAFIDYGVEKEGNVYHIDGNPDTCVCCVAFVDSHSIIECILKSKGLWA